MKKSVNQLLNEWGMSEAADEVEQWSGSIGLALTISGGKVINAERGGGVKLDLLIGQPYSRVKKFLESLPLEKE